MPPQSPSPFETEVESRRTELTETDRGAETGRGTDFRVTISGDLAVAVEDSRDEPPGTVDVADSEDRALETARAMGIVDGTAETDETADTDLQNAGAIHRDTVDGRAEGRRREEIAVRTMKARLRQSLSAAHVQHRPTAASTQKTKNESYNPYIINNS